MPSVPLLPYAVRRLVFPFLHPSPFPFKCNREKLPEADDAMTTNRNVHENRLRAINGAAVD